MGNLKYNKLVFAISISLILFIVYQKVLGLDILSFDDLKHTLQNPNLNPLTLDGFLTIWKSSYFKLYIPVTYSAWALDFLIYKVLFSSNPTSTWFHFINLIIHMLNTFIVFEITQKLYQNRKVDNYLPSLFAALFFALHPLQVETVSWISERRTLLSFLFSGMALNYFIKYLNFDLISKKEKVFEVSRIVLLLTISYLSKPTSFVVPYLMLVLAIFKSPLDFKKTILPIGISILIQIPIYIMTVSIQTFEGEVMHISFWDRFKVIFDSLNFYIIKIFAPLNLIVDYGRNPEFVIQNGEVPIFSILLVLLFIYFIIKKQNNISMLILCFFITLLPNIGLVNFTFQMFSTVADRYLYFAFLPLALIISEIVQKALLLKNLKVKRLIIITITILLLTLSCLSRQQVSNWQNDFTLFSNVLRVNSHSMLGYTFVGSHYVSIRRYDLAEYYISKAIINSKNWKYKEELIKLLRFIKNQKRLGTEK